jgi:CTP synthase (UTP-ammonia lyase)
MKEDRKAHIGLIGDYSADVVAHRGIERTLRLAADAGVAVEWTWLHTRELANEPQRIESFGAFWCVPASPYASMDAALVAIRFAREEERPFLGTCGGFQHALIEYARNVLGIAGADHAETGVEGADLVVTPLACALVGQTGGVVLKAGTRIREICGSDRLVEGYHCSYGVNPVYRARFEAAGLRFCAEDDAGDVRAFELAGHPFFIGTLFQPERRALQGTVHPLCMAFLRAAAVARV